MSGEVGSIKPNPYIFDIENRRKRHLRLAHDLGAGARCKKCGDKCPGFELHFWRKICMNCRCGKDDHEVEDDDQDIGKVVIGKLFDRPARTKKEELEFSYGNALEMVNEETGKAEKVKFDWVPPNTEKNLAARYMALLPPEKRPVAGSEAAKERRKQLEQQLPLYDMDATQRCENMPAEELQSFEAYLERIKTQVAGQGIVQEIIGLPLPSMAQPLQSYPQRDSQHGSAGGYIIDQNYPAQPLQSYPPKDSQLGSSGGNITGWKYPAAATKGDSLYDKGNDTYTVPYPPLNQPLDQQYHQAGPQGSTRQPGLKAFMEGIVSGSGRHVATSQPYGVAPGTSHALKGAGQDHNVRGVAGQLSELHLTESKQGLPTGEPQLGSSAGGGHEGEMSLQHTSGPAAAWPPLPAPVYGYIQTPTSQSASIHSQGTPGQESFVPDTQGSLPSQKGFVPARQGSLPGQEGFVPGTQGSLPSQKGFVPSKQGSLSGQEGFVPGTQGSLPGQAFVPGKQGSLPSQEGFMPGTQSSLPDQESFVPGRQGSLLGQEGFVQDRQGSLPGQEGFVLGRQGPLPSQEGLVPGRQGFLHNLGGPLQPLSVASEVQPLTPGRDTVIHGYHTGGSEPANTLAYQKAEVPGSYRPSEWPAGSASSKEGGKGFLLQMSPRQGSVIKEELLQVPYATYKETLAGGIQVAPGSDVTVLFPGESQVLGSQGRSGAVPGQKSKFSCQYCSLPMNVGDVAIFCERAGPDKCWHPACFCCFTCKELLADLIYFFKDGKVYCGRHFTEAADMPRCKACDELIFGNSWTRADDADWHIHHYCCNICDKPLAGQRYVPDKDGYPHCMSCYMTCLAKMCQTCEEKIAPNENRCSHRGYCYHANPQCFQCHSCKTPLLGRKFKMSKNWLFCSNDCIQAAAAELATNTNPKEAPQ